ncbi:DUF3604 domain-containing protein [Gammaproteobacteria bacterium]|nr:DUF3604 domain-containing protein [Gammaproteobacteria bacterium]
MKKLSKMTMDVVCSSVCLVLMFGCGQQDRAADVTGEQASDFNLTDAVSPTKSTQRSAFFGDLHVHTANSFDAFNFGVRATADDAYRYAKGEVIDHPAGYPIRLRGGPLDFYGVSDHAEYLGAVPALADPDHPLATHRLAKIIQSGDPNDANEAFSTLGAIITQGRPVPDLDATAVIRSAWQANIEAAERHYVPGEFTTFIAYEYTSNPDGAGLHRNVIFASERAPEAPYGGAESLNPEDLWDWLDSIRAEGMEALAIPHNSNVSLGKMFQTIDWAGAPIDQAYADRRSRNEPLIEITQVKGTSETHPLLSPNDEWASFEVWKLSRTVVNEDGFVSRVSGATDGAYARDALRKGLELELSAGANPYDFGFIGSSDGHDASSPIEEDQYFGKLGLFDGSAEARGSLKSTTQSALGVDTLEWGASGLAGVWAEENTRESIYAALRRKETFATSGPRIQVRFFAGYDYPLQIEKMPETILNAYANGVPMGGELLARENKTPRFLVWALRDPRDSWLQRIQIVKGWIDNEGTHERIFDVACSDGMKPDPVTYRCPENGASVDLSDCGFSIDRGDVELKTVWVDPTFDAGQRAFYYVRAIQNPTCRWSTWDALRAGEEPSSRVPATIQERAWSSPIWYRPSH